MGSKEGRLEAADFDLRVSMECGQIFGWEWDGEWCYGTIGGRGVALRQEGATIHFVAERDLEPGAIATYLGMDEDYAGIMESISVDDFVRRAIDAGWGLRIFKQDAWPCLGSYILSSNNRVERIRTLVGEISRTMGGARRVRNRLVYTFPEPAVLAACRETDIRACGAGFRSPYLSEGARMIAAGEVDLDVLSAMPYADARETLKRLPGVGDKIADCVLLFAFSFHEAFPVDVWIKRAVLKVYFASAEVSAREIQAFARSHFGEYAGYAQEYIYYYARKFGLE
jgi:N-glycosylase/DNA lyase